MWVLSKHSRQKALEHSQLQLVILQRTAELRNLSRRLLEVQDEERRKSTQTLRWYAESVISYFQDYLFQLVQKADTNLRSSSLAMHIREGVLTPIERTIRHKVLLVDDDDAVRDMMSSCV